MTEEMKREIKRVKAKLKYREATVDGFNYKLISPDKQKKRGRKGKRCDDIKIELTEEEQKLKNIEIIETLRERLKFLTIEFNNI